MDELTLATLKVHAKLKVILSDAKDIRSAARLLSVKADFMAERAAEALIELEACDIVRQG